MTQESDPLLKYFAKYSGRPIYKLEIPVYDGSELVRTTLSKNVYLADEASALTKLFDQQGVKPASERVMKQENDI